MLSKLGSSWTGMIMKSIANKFEHIFAAVAFAEGGEFEIAKGIMEEFHAQRIQYSHSNENRLERLKPLRAGK